MEEIILRLNDVLSPEETSTLEEHKASFKEHLCVANARLVCRLPGYECVEGYILPVLDNSRDMRF